MCTVSYFPISTHEFVLTSNRDVPKVRALAAFPEIRSEHGKTFMAPIDQDAHGTWIFTTPSGITACLLNGAFEKHRYTPPYRKSRGHVVLDVLKYFSVNAFVENIVLESIEPFTLILIDSKEANQELYTLVWDGVEKHFKKHNPTQPHIWASSTLYTATQKKWVSNSFEEYSKKLHLKNLSNDLQSFHWCGMPKNDPKMIRINNNSHQTVSTTQVVRQNGKVVMHYFDLIQNLESTLHFRNELV